MASDAIMMASMLSGSQSTNKNNMLSSSSDAVTFYHSNTSSTNITIPAPYEFPDWVKPGELVIDADENIWMIQCEFTEETRNGAERGFLQVVSIDDETIEKEVAVGQVEHYL